MVLRLERRVKRALRLLRRRTKENGLVMRCQIVLLAAKDVQRRRIAEAVGCSVSWVDSVIRRFRASGVAGLEDRRQDNGDTKLDEDYLATLIEVVGRSPRDYGHRRPTWTRELLVAVMAKQTGVKVHVGTMSRALQQIRARRGRPQPTVGCPWAKAAKARRMRLIHRLIETLGDDEVAVWEDEVDVHLNPRIGLDWMNRGQQKQVMTPGQNHKRHLAGAMDAATGVLTWVESDRKNGDLLITVLRRLVQAYPQAKKIHLILDNDRIHHSRITQQAVQALGGRIVLHFLPPYCPQHNRIERVWLDLHANVPRNHNHAAMDELMRDVRHELRQRNRRKHRQLRLAG
jgi:transposase